MMRAIGNCVLGDSPAVARGVGASHHSVESSILDTPYGRVFSHLVTCLAFAPSSARPALPHSSLYKQAVDIAALPTQILSHRRDFYSSDDTLPAVHSVVPQHEPRAGAVLLSRNKVRLMHPLG